MTTQPVEAITDVFDWSNVHKPATDILYSLSVHDENDWSKLRLDDEQVKQFWSDGFLNNISILTTEQCDLILNDYETYLGGPVCTHPGRQLLYKFSSNPDPTAEHPNTGSQTVVNHVQGQWRLTPLFHDLIFHPKVLVACSQLLVENEEKIVRFWQDQFFAKPAKYGGVVAWHQDYSLWTQTVQEMHITVHLALDDQTLENGCVYYVPGSHRWRYEDDQPFPDVDFDFKNMDGIKKFLNNDQLEAVDHARPALLKKGEVSIHSSMTVHGSGVNRSDNPRRAIVLAYFADGVVSNANTPLLSKKGHPQFHSGANIPKGQKMEGQFYPIVFDPEWPHQKN